MEYRYNPEDGSFYSLADSKESLLELLGASFGVVNYTSNVNIEKTRRDSATAEDFVFLCEMGITPDLTIEEK